MRILFVLLLVGCSNSEFKRTADKSEMTCVGYCELILTDENRRIENETDKEAIEQ